VRRLWRFALGFLLLATLLQFMLALISGAQSERGNDELIGLSLVMLLMLFSTLAIVAAAVWLASKLLGLSFDFSTLSSRLWRIVVAVVIVLLIDRTPILFASIPT
jgi:hypothetical protein